MRLIRFKLGATLAALLALHVSPLLGQVTFCSNQISGTVTFANTDPGILSLLSAPNNDGMLAVRATASSVPFDRSSYSDQPAATRTRGAYRATVDATDAGLVYAVTPQVTLAHQSYSFASQLSSPVICGGPEVVRDFSECVGVVELRFVTAGHVPISVNVADLFAYNATTAAETARLFATSAGTTMHRLYLHGGLTHRLDIRVYRGTDLYTDRMDHFVSMNVAVTCDRTNIVEVIIPDAGTLGRIVGNVDMLREFEWNIDGINRIDSTGVAATSGPFGNQRWAALGGDNLLLPSSGPFSLDRVVPSTLDPASSGYAVWAQMYFRRNRLFQGFLTPYLGSGANPPVVVPPGATINLGNTLVIDPGYLHGNVLLQGPLESLGRTSLLRGLRHPGDHDLNDDGIPDVVGTYGVYWTAVAAAGVNRRASGATNTASGGLAQGDFAGTFDAVSSAIRGTYDLALGGLNGERSIWRPTTLSLYWNSDPGTADEDSYFQTFYIADRATNDFEIVPGNTVNHDIAYCFSEVCVRFRSRAGQFYAPTVRFSSGSFTGTDFRGQPADYYVSLDAAQGSPRSALTASDHGQVVMYLPQGTYNLAPFVTSVESSLDYGTGLQPITNLVVGCGERICLTPCLQMDLAIPPCASSRTQSLAGTVRSCTNVVKIIYQLDDGPSQVICTSCGLNPAFNFAFTVTGDCSNHRLTVTAVDADGDLTSKAGFIRFDNQPPVIACPPNIVTNCAGPGGTGVAFSATATDNCPDPVVATCVPPSGSLFPAGLTTVRCTARDLCGNLAECTFTVTVLDTTPPTIHCPTNIVVECNGTNGTVVEYAVPATDNCATNLTVTCTPPSGSLFPLGCTTVVCKAIDDSGNLARCEFQVCVRPPLLSIEKAIIVRWSCGVLQCSSSADGPWIDLPAATSPYCVPISLPQKFYRVRE